MKSIGGVNGLLTHEHYSLTSAPQDVLLSFLKNRLFRHLTEMNKHKKSEKYQRKTNNQ